MIFENNQKNLLKAFAKCLKVRSVQKSKETQYTKIAFSSKLRILILKYFIDIREPRARRTKEKHKATWNMSQSTASLVPEGNQGSLQEDVSFDFNGVPGQALDAVRMRLAQLTHSLRRIRDEMSKAELPQWYTLQSQLNVTLSQLVSVTSTLQYFQETLDSTVVYPLPKFPTTSHESLVTTLLRKKNIPEVDEWMKYVRETSGVTTALLKDEEIEKLLQQDREITNWARTTFRNEYGKHDFKNEESLSEEHASLLVRDSKPSKPFNVDDVLKFTFTGEKPLITGSTSTSSSN